MTNQEAATALGISRRQVQRLKRRWQAGGLAAVIHGLRGRPWNRRLPGPVRRQAATLLQTTYAGFTDVHPTEKLRKLHQLPISRPSVRRLRQALGIPAQRPRRPPKHRRRRARADAIGRLVQLDGSPFAWLEDRGPTGTLLGAIDDASGQILALEHRFFRRWFFVFCDELFRSLHAASA
jgi:transposase